MISFGSTVISFFFFSFSFETIYNDSCVETKRSKRRKIIQAKRKGEKNIFSEQFDRGRVCTVKKKKTRGHEGVG